MASRKKVSFSNHVIFMSLDMDLIHQANCNSNFPNIKPLTAAQLAEAELQQLRYEASLPKMKVSEATKELQVCLCDHAIVILTQCNLLEFFDRLTQRPHQTYIEAHQNEDYLVKGFEASPKKNPFRKKKFSTCNLF